MRFHRRHSLYPLAIALLTLALGTLMFLTLSRPARTDDAPAVPAVSEADYRAAAHRVLVPFLTAYQDASRTDVDRIVATEDALRQIGGMVVPVSYKDVHLGLAVSLTLIRDGLRGEAGALDKGNAKLMRLIGDYPWLAN